MIDFESSANDAETFLVSTGLGHEIVNFPEP